MKKGKLKWGILGVAKIAVEKVIPAMRKSKVCEVVGIASRNLSRALHAAEMLDIPRAYGSYEDLLADEDIDVIYNPLPNHLHIPLTILAAQAGKHVLCEKPIALSSLEAKKLLQVREQTGVKIEEAFMVRTHPQWLWARELVQSGQIGKLTAIQSTFSYYNRDPKNIRNIAGYGGGGLMDIGCYPITTSRFILDREPERVIALMEYDPDLGVDRLTSGILDFGEVQSSFVCGTQMTPFQRVFLFGTSKRIEIEIPFNAPPDRPCNVFVDGGDLQGKERELVDFPVCDQYTIQADLFSESILKNTHPPIGLENSIKNMSTIDALVASAKSGKWERPNEF